MAKASEQFRQSDVTIWGMVALVAAGLAVFGSNVSLLVPQSIIGGLHQPRVAGASIETLRQQVAELRDETLRLRRENEVLLSRFAMQEKSGSDITRRVGALETTVPQMLEAMPSALAVDRSSFTGSIGAGQTQVFDAEGGSVAIRQTPLESAPAQAQAQAMPDPIQPATSTAYAVALGESVPADTVAAVWNDLNVKVGPLLFGMSPLLSEAGNGNERIIVGPIEQIAEARSLCQRLEQVSISCVPAPYQGQPLTIAP